MRSYSALPGSVIPLVVVPCLNEAAHVARVVSRMRADIQGTGGLVVIVDGGSTDGTQAIAREIASTFPDVAFLDNPARLQGPGINAAVARFGDRYTHLIRVDAHCDYPDGFVAALTNDEVRTGAASVVVGMVARGEALLQRINASTQNSRIGNGGSGHRRQGTGRFVEHGHHALIRLDAFRQVGGYDETFSHNEDAEMDVRLLKAGHRIWLSGSTHVIYYPRRTIRDLGRQYFNYGRGRAKNLMKHMARPNLRQGAVIAFGPLVVVATMAPVAPVLALPALAWSATALSGGFALAITNRKPLLLLSGPIALVMHLAWSTGFWTQVLAAPRRSRKAASA